MAAEEDAQRAAGLLTAYERFGRQYEKRVGMLSGPNIGYFSQHKFQGEDSYEHKYGEDGRI